MQKSRNKILAFIVVLVLVVLVALPVIAAFLFLEKAPAVYGTKAVDVKHAAITRSFAKRVISDVTSPKKLVLLFAEENELNAVAAFANRTIPILSGRISIEDMGMVAVMTLQLPENPFGRYINTRIYFSPSDNGLDISKFAVGKIRIHHSIAQLFIKTSLNILLGNGQGTAIFDAVKKVSFKDQVVSVQFTPLPDIKMRFNMFKDRIKKFRDSVNPVCDPAIVKIYYKKLIEIERTFQSDQKISLSKFMAPLFELANRRSNTGNHSEENAAALLALSVYAGHWRFEQFTGDVRSDQMPSNPSITKNMVLAGRQDLRLHFIVSAGIKVIADAGVSFAAGEFKELLDAQYGGSGFSFADLAADRAGTYFAQMAISDSKNSEKLQRIIMRNPEETVFFPDIRWLPEGISQDRFKAEFEHVASDRYKALVNSIDQQIMNLPLYN